MTWRRVGENTYIDDTLVTCAEYQLFIDEMLEQEKYYQPDHWTSYQYPKGQAREPILGVRHSDAVEFCAWLTEREDTKWKYRIPSLNEIDEYPIVRFFQQSGGFWIVSDEENLSFAKLSSHIKKFRVLPEFAIRQLVKNIEVERENTHVRNNFLPNAIADRNELQNKINEDYFSLSIAHLIDRARAFNLDQSIDENVDQAIDRSQNRGLDIGYDLNLDNLLALSPDCSITCNLMWDLDLALDLLVDVIDFRDRVAGRSPAFEGIRLVKERIK